MPDINVTPVYCICGRLAGKPHCPHCGSSQVLASARKRDFVTRSNGDVAELRVFRCRVCASLFNDDDWQIRCNAAPPRTSAQPPEIRLERLVNPKVPEFIPEQFQEHLKKIQRARGIVSDDTEKK